MVSAALNQQLTRIAKLSETERKRHEQHYSLMQEILHLGRGLLSKPKTFSSLMKSLDVVPSRGKNPWLNVCRVVSAYATRTYKQDYTFIDGFAGYLRHFDINHVARPGNLDVPSYIDKFNDFEFGRGLTAIKNRDSKDHNLDKLRNQNIIGVGPRGLTPGMAESLERYMREVRKCQVEPGFYNEHFDRLVQGQIESATKQLATLNAKSSA